MMRLLENLRVPLLWYAACPLFAIVVHLDRSTACSALSTCFSKRFFPPWRASPAVSESTGAEPYGSSCSAPERT